MTKIKKLGKSLVIILALILIGFVFIDLITGFLKKTVVSNIHPIVTDRKEVPIKICSGQIPNIPFVLPAGYTIHIFAHGLDTPRDLQFTNDGTLLVSDPSGNKVYALPDKNEDGVADENKVVVENEPHVHGLAIFGNNLFVADTTRVVKYTWNETGLSATNAIVLFSLPQNSDHNNRTLAVRQDGKLFISLGSTCNVCNEPPLQGGSVLISNTNGSTPKVYATGLRNAAFLAINPVTNALWGTEMGRDNLGDNIPPDEINIINEGQDYGWPKCYGDKVHDTNFDKNKFDSCAATTSPIYQIAAHSAPLGLTFINSDQFPSSWQGDLLVAFHGSWNRSVAIGFKVVHMKVIGNSITSEEDFLTGFNTGITNEDSLGRPVDMVFDKKGNLYLSDDKAGNVYIIQRTSNSS